MTALLDAALNYAARGLAVFPCVPLGKEPAIKGGFYAATTNPETLNRYWRQAKRNIGIRAGAASGFWALDVDPDRNGEESLRGLEATHGPLPASREVITGGGGRHIWFRYTVPISCSAGKIAPGIDTRGDGGYVIVPPSIHPSGRAYAWSTDSADELAIAPDWLVQLACRKPAPISVRAVTAIRRPCNGSSPGAYGAAALENEITALAQTVPGSRNHALNRAAFSLFQLVAGGELEESEVLLQLIKAAHANGLMSDDGPQRVRRTIESGRRAGLQYPRTRSGAA